MRFILTLLMTSALAFGLACQNASSSSTSEKTKEDTSATEKNSEKTVEKEKAETKSDSQDDADGHNHGGEAPRITLADAKKDYDAGNAVMIDTRSETAFNNEHIKGAINVPAGNFEKAYNKVPKDKKIIAYCS